jgi:hypothetical protein
MKLKNIILFPTIVKVQKEKEEPGSIDLTQERSIKLVEKSVLPPDLSKSCKELDDYLSTLKRESEMSQRRQLRYAKMAKTRQQNVVKQKNVVEFPVDNRKVFICNNTLEDSRIIVEKRVGYKLVCPHCNWSWVWHGRKDRFFVSCSRCHKTFKLNWK